MQSLNKKKQATQQDIDDLKAGNKTVGTAFKNNSDLPKLNFEMERLSKEVDQMQNLLDILTVYLGRDSISVLKETKIALYKKVFR